VDIGRRIRDRRKALNLSQEALARRAGVSLNLINRVERGETRDPHYSTLASIAGALEVPIGELLEERQAPKVQAPLSSPVHPNEAEEKRREEIEQHVEELEARNHQFGIAARVYRMSWRDYLDNLAERWEGRLEEGVYTPDIVSEFFSNLLDMSQSVLRALEADRQVNMTLVEHAIKHGTTTDLSFIQEEMELTGATYAAHRLIRVADAVYHAARSSFEDAELLEKVDQHYKEAQEVFRGVGSSDT
jgi:transcriptional regulator with XRE-family HTH domain